MIVYWVFFADRVKKVMVARGISASVVMMARIFFFMGYLSFWSFG